LWPWSIPAAGVPAFLVFAGLLVALTLWTYLGVRGASSRRIGILIGLRLAALILAFLAMLRPSVAFRDEADVPSTLLIAVDNSESMTIQDEHADKSRWDNALQILRDSEPELTKLRDEHKVTIQMRQFAGAVADFDPDGKATGKRTDFGQMLQSLYERHQSERFLRGLVILSDGADNGARYPALPLAGKFRTLPCPIHTFGFGKTTTSAQLRDIAFTSIRADPSPVAIKGKLAIKGMVDAPGFEKRTVTVSLSIDDKPITSKDVKLTKTTGNEIELVTNAPETPGEIKVALKIAPLNGEMTVANNEISTYVTVTKEGISVLYVEGKYRAWEPKYIRYALSQEPSVVLFEAVRLSDAKPQGAEAEFFDFDKKHYDVIILGDITARRLSGGDMAVLGKIRKLVAEKGAGLIMIGGYESFGNSDWNDTEVAKALPVDMDATGQIDGAVQMVPTREGLRHYVMRLADREDDNRAIWAKLPKLDGMTRLGNKKPGTIVLAQSPNGAPILVGETYGKGRTLAFSGDTTWRWCNSLDGLSAHARFWRQIVLWLAKRDEAEGNVLVIPDSRRVPAGAKLGMTVKLRGKGSVEIPEKDARFDVKVIGPDKAEYPVTIVPDKGQQRGVFWKTDAAGEYQIVANGRGTDVDGKPLENLPPATVRFVVYQDEAEMARQAADHEFLGKLANAGGGKFHQPEELKRFLSDLGSLPLPQFKPKTRLWPDWRKTPPSRSANSQVSSLTSSGILPIYILFVLIICFEWLLRRIWGLV
jgi:uncharacterized membrane protein